MQGVIERRWSPWFLGLPVAVGAGIVYFPLVTLAVALGACFVAYVVWRGIFVWWDIFIAALAGCLVLTYGFANVGVSGLPLADLLLVTLLLRARAKISAPFVWGALFLGWASIRLFWDHPEYGVLALRDFTLPLEMLWAVVGFWMMGFGKERWIRALRWVFLGVLVHALAFQWSGLATLGPVVGLDHPVPLIGNHTGLDAALAIGGFFFLLLKPFGRYSYVPAAISFPVVLTFQSRSLYLLIPAIFLLLWLLASESRVRLAGAVALGVGALVLMFMIVPQGRLGEGTPDFYVEHFQTLLGEEGLGSGSIRSRQTWASETLNQVAAERNGWLTGVGLGPDLISGFTSATGELVRKPHNDYLEIYARYGLVGLVPFCLALVVAFTRIVSYARRTHDLFVWWLIAVAIIYMGVAAVQPLLSFPFGTLPLFVCIGAGLALLTRGQSFRS